MTRAEVTALDTRLRTIEEQLKSWDPKDMLEEILRRTAGLDDIYKEISEVKKSVEFMSTQYDLFNAEITTLKQTNEVFSKEMKNIECQYARLLSEIETVQSAMMEDSGTLRATCLIINGLPVNDNDLAQDILKIARKVNVNVQMENIVKVYRLKGKFGKQSPVKVIFDSAEICRNFLKQAKKEKLSSTALGYSGPNVPVFFNEDLNAYSRRVLGEVLKFKKAEGWKYAWTKEGKIFLKKTDGSEVHSVVNARILDKLRLNV